ncbi:MAG: efflux RND transporter periplasmic adaptor subunit [Planctomycetes bacterium]|nr:efflux RND transporter periplasmic adaptor subunit [Planctomycetota bacterium]
MKSKKIIALIAVVLVVCLLGYRAVRSIEHDAHDHSEHAETPGQIDEHQGHDDNEDPDEHETHNDDEDIDEHQDKELAIGLTDEEIKEIGLETTIAGAGTVNIDISLPGEIRINEDQMAHVVPRVEGVVAQVYKKLGDTVNAGDTLAVIESQSLADAKAGYLAAVERHEMAKLSFDREEKLWKEKISSQQDYLEKKQALTEASIAKRAAEQKLHAIGFDESYLKKLPGEPEQLLTRFEIKAPFKGTIIEKHIVLGELVATESAVYIVADLSSVWIDLQVYPKDLRSIKKGCQVVISANSEIPDTKGIISYVGPVLGTESRTALARAVLANDSGVFRPGLFITAQIAVSKTQAKVVVPKTAIQSLEGKKCVFTKDAHGFEPAFIEIGLQNATHAEILSGLAPGQEYVTKGAFTLKSKIVTSTLDSHAGHGH